MAATITLSDVKENSIASGIPDSSLTGFIALVDQADTCLDANSVSDDIQTAIKLNGVWFLCASTSRGGVTSEKSATGASRSFSDGSGYDSNGYGQVLKGLDQYGCLTSILTTGKTALIEVC